jgi:hypothetical protein
VRAYFEKFATFSFPRQQIHFPRCQGAWFKEINTLKVMTRTALSTAACLPECHSKQMLHNLFLMPPSLCYGP